MQSVSATLQYLQLVIPDPNEAEEFWRSVRACSELVALQLAFMPELEEAGDQQGEQQVRWGYLKASLESYDALVAL